MWIIAFIYIYIHSFTFRLHLILQRRIVLVERDFIYMNCMDIYYRYIHCFMYNIEV